MAEERIFVEKLTVGTQYTCGIGGICSGRCEESENCGKGISRQEAIEKIETHLKASTIKFSTTPDVVAEIALNALLEADNGGH